MAASAVCRFSISFRGRPRTHCDLVSCCARLSCPARRSTRRTAFRRISLTPLGRSGALLIGTLSVASGFTLTVTASTRRPVRLAFAGIPNKTTLEERLAAEIPSSLYYDDIHGRPDWRRHMTFEFAEEIRSELSEGRA
jgi:hypothetical protein